MADKYDKFAKDTFGTINTAISESLNNSQGALLVFVPERHYENAIIRSSNQFINDDLQEPNRATIYPQISALHASVIQVGLDNVVMSIEMDEASLAELSSGIRNNDHKVPENITEVPSLHTLAYALANNISVVASDPMASDSNNPERDYFINDAISSIVRDTDAPPSVVVHVGGFWHMNNMQGHSDEVLYNNIGRLSSNNASSPLSNAYTKQIYINSVRLPSQLVGFFEDATIDGGFERDLGLPHAQRPIVHLKMIIKTLIGRSLSSLL